jgi:hypothetical protein
VTGPRRALSLLPGRLAVCRLAPDAPLPAWAMHAEAALWSVTRTPRELSVVCDEDALPPSVERAEIGWRAFALEGPIPFDEIGVLSGLVAPLAGASVPAFVLSTFDTDLVLVKDAHLAAARAAWAKAGIEVSGPAC